MMSQCKAYRSLENFFLFIFIIVRKKFELCALSNKVQQFNFILVRIHISPDVFVSLHNGTCVFSAKRKTFVNSLTNNHG